MLVQKLMHFPVLLSFRESEGSFRYGNYRREVDDLRDVVEHFCGAHRSIVAIVGHSKGWPVCRSKYTYDT